MKAVLDKTFPVTGMTCGGCAAGVKKKLEALPEVEFAEVDHVAASAHVKLKSPVAASYLSEALGEKYTLSEPFSAESAFDRNDAPQSENLHTSQEDTRTWFETYRPLLTIVGLIALVAALAQVPLGVGFDGSLWMRHFMAGFFIVFAGFKLLDVAGFSESYAMYDVIAARWKGWGSIYPFVELGLGLAYLTNVAPFAINLATIVILGVSAVGVIQSVLDKRTIKCACLGTGFNLPMSTVTIIEDLGMVAMAAIMLILS